MTRDEDRREHLTSRKVGHRDLVFGGHGDAERCKDNPANCQTDDSRSRFPLHGFLLVPGSAFTSSVASKRDAKWRLRRSRRVDVTTLSIFVKGRDFCGLEREILGA
jgi:hypothetical protein